MSKFLRIALKLLFLLFVLGVVLFGFVYIYFFKSSLNSYVYAQPKLVKINRGMRFRQIVDELTAQKIIKRKEPLLVVAYFTSEAKNIKPGRYYIPSGLTSVELVRFLHTRKQDEIRITVREGLEGREIAQVIHDEMDTDSAAFMRAFSDSLLLAEMNVTSPNFEGYLLPDTYNIPWASTERDIVKFFVSQFRKFYSDSLRAIGERAGLSEIEVLTLASIVQAETPDARERPIVAGVYLNRLKKGMKLQADPTVEYAIGEGHRRLLFSDLKFDSPYNTYLYEGLPPGPINNPDKSAILAVLNPARTQYLFFVATGTGGHRFAEDAYQHNANAEVYYQFMREKRAREDSLKQAGQN
ncbi:MAG: endolytic transglycosylase MltG [Rhizobacter sp.]|nr:endolytic transglycosylase MltG [Chlorobiales bacterium]